MLALCTIMQRASTDRCEWSAGSLDFDEFSLLKAYADDEGEVSRSLPGVGDWTKGTSSLGALQGWAKL